MAKLLLMLLLLSLSMHAKHLRKEKHYQEHFCKLHKGISEYTLQDKTRVDCLLDEYAIEVDFAHKWAESIGQSLYYAVQTSRKAAVLLIMEEQGRDQKYLKRLETLSKKHKITIWTIDKRFRIREYRKL